MLARTGRPGQRALLISLHSSTRTAPAVLPHLNISRPAQIFLRFASTRAHTFWTSDDPLIKALRRRQESYRLRQVGDGARRKAERLEAVQLAKSEIRWIVQHVRKLQAASPSESSTGKAAKSTLNRASRRALVSMATRMTRENVPISYLLGSVPFGSLAEELTVRPPILLPRPETEHWATEVVTTLLDTLGTTPPERPVRVVDLCTGSGCIALLVADALRARLGTEGNWSVVACDRSPLAVELACENAQKLGFDPGSNVHILQADIFSDADMDNLANLAGGAFDLILSNPPYIPRREWNTLSPEVKTHEDPAALIGERDILTSADATQCSDARQSWLDRHGLAFHQRLGELLYRPTFSSAARGLPRLVAEYGKGQQRMVEKLHAELRAPKDRLPRIVRVEGHKLVVVGVGNATTHPETRHSIGQVVLDPLLRGLVEQDRRVRARLGEIRDQLEQTRLEALESGRVDRDQRRDWSEPVPMRFTVHTSPSSSGRTDKAADGGVTELQLDEVGEAPARLSKVTEGKSGGWAAHLSLLVPSTPAFFTSRGVPEDVYQVDVALYKPSQAMNLSGVGLRHFLHAHHPFYTSPSLQHSDAAGETGWRIEDDVLVLQDELDLAFGEVKPKHAGSARGHNGVRDILARLDIPDSTSKSKGGEGAGAKLSRLRIGIGRPELTPAPAKKEGGWLPASLQGRKSKPVPIDRWVLSPLTEEELDSCRTVQGESSVAAQVHNATVEWITQRCHSLTRRIETNEGGAMKVTSRKDQFGVYRTVWVH